MLFTPGAGSREYGLEKKNFTPSELPPPATASPNSALSRSQHEPGVRIFQIKTMAGVTPIPSDKAEKRTQASPASGIIALLQCLRSQWAREGSLGSKRTLLLPHFLRKDLKLDWPAARTPAHMWPRQTPEPLSSWKPSLRRSIPSGEAGKWPASKSHVTC